jgi:6-phosphofructokinase 1
MKHIAIFTSGGDAPGMNAAIRAVVRTAISKGLQVSGILHGYEGMINNEFVKMNLDSVSNIIQTGGTILKTSRSERFKTAEGRKLAFENLQKNKIDGFIALGGDGTFTGANVFKNEFNIPCVGVPCTIDKDLSGTDFTIGFDTAVNTAMYAIDKIRDTADAHDRIFFVEVMGRDAGYIALNAGIATGAEEILIPETPTYLEDLYKHLGEDFRRKKMCHIIIVAEGDDAGHAMDVAEKVKQKFPTIDARVAVLGHIQRGGSPTYFDRVLASRLGFAAVEALLEGNFQVMAGLENDKIIFTPFEKVIKNHPPIDKQILRMLKILSA